MNYQPVIGLEVHIELSTKSKMFCSCSADYFGTKPNTHTCPVCLGLPGAMPKANKLAIEFVQKLGLALNCQPQLSSKFDRKNYFYPDLPKGFQISQYDLPFSKKGFLIIRVNGSSGVPLMEVVSEPEMSSAAEAKAYAQKLQQIVRYLEISDADMEKGSMRIEPNVSLRDVSQVSKVPRVPHALPNYKVELKNINSFRFAEKAINYEIERQTQVLKSGKIPHQETRGWDEKNNRTVSQRTKELAHDYRYFPEPDLPPFNCDQVYFSKLQSQIPELPDQKRERFLISYQILESEATLLCQDKYMANFFEETVKAYKGSPKKVVNWITGELLRRLNQTGQGIGDINLLPAQLAELLYFVDQNRITNATAKEIFEKMIQSTKSASELISELDLVLMSQKELEKLTETVIKNNQKAVADFKNDKKESLDFLIGQVQRLSKGKADPALVRQLLLDKLKS
ncbi:MAG: Aspartyl/glutamyl-tRNA(Asn/Gln) amidotransferase subunit B [Candidatus Curtissbacteria bacterium GW2011_GWA2_41_24]|uniref:Aspartyl/glutamyl-tRNA(Asn/Gln) amidotransferase subunit B n=1 Tax=Candidatus Curtissbacteria bacterium GW2011_GWA2_41_24 TaxID=1618411 RepID=A0A0G0VPP3_9BACT|nr:MAG: Aspartyl/glutamyl-tRNA(Asn/Gln) amidotransferase subunit B [Candidatus Curtissbacteria bacterium GW2011_GWA2_41_24]